MAARSTPQPCAEAVVLRGSEVLLMRRARDPWRGAWEVPGGFCEEAEHPALAAQRELREEVGVEGRVVAYIGSWIDVYGTAQDNRTDVHTLNCAYLVELVEPDFAPVLQAEEVLEVGWFQIAALPEPLAFPNHMAAVIHAAGRLDPEDLPPLLDLVP